MLTREKYINSPVEIQFELLHLLDKNNEQVIFDIGACEAEDSIRYSNIFPKSTVYAFEPRPDNCSKAKELILKNNKHNIVIEQLALSNQNGIAEFHVSEGEPKDLQNDENWDYGNKSSSLLPPSEQLKKHTEWLNFNQSIKVNTLRLDCYVEEKKIEKIDFIHMDVQGAELMVLEGAGSFLSKIKIVWLEVEAVELYKGQPLKNDVENFMKKNNFINFLDTVDNISGDQLYLNRQFFSDQFIKKLKSKSKNRSFVIKIKSFLKRKF